MDHSLRMKTIVELTADEGLSAGVVGCIQMMRAVRTGKVGHDHGGFSGRDMRERWAQAIHGQMVEHAVSKFFNCYPHAGIDGIRGDDPGGFSIRGTPHENGHLIVNRSELPAKAETRFVLVVGHWPTFRIVGWIKGSDVMREDWWRANERPPSWWVPQASLNQIVI
jgi:hypothetical protein